MKTLSLKDGTTPTPLPSPKKKPHRAPSEIPFDPRVAICHVCGFDRWDPDSIPHHNQEEHEASCRVRGWMGKRMLYILAGGDQPMPKPPPPPAGSIEANRRLMGPDNVRYSSKGRL